MSMNSSTVTAGTNATSTQYNNLRKDVNNSVKDPVTATDAATVTFTLTSGALQKVVLGGNRTLAFSGALAGQTFIIILKQDATGSRTVTWPTIKWIDSTTPVLTTTANAVDIFSIFYDGTDYYGTIVGLNFG